jgi:hypothetical protein
MKEAATKKKIAQYKKACEEERKWFLIERFASIATIVHKGGPVAQTLGDVNSAIK